MNVLFVTVSNPMHQMNYVLFICLVYFSYRIPLSFEALNMLGYTHEISLLLQIVK